MVLSKRLKSTGKGSKAKKLGAISIEAKRYRKVIFRCELLLQRQIRFYFCIVSSLAIKNEYIKTISSAENPNESLVNHQHQQQSRVLLFEGIWWIRNCGLL